MTKIIQLVGALLGTLLGFALGLLILSKADTTVIEAPNRPAFLMAMVAATLLFGYLAIPYVTTRPARWAVDRLAQAGAGEFALGVAAIVVGLLVGVLAGLPLIAIGGWAGSVLPPVVAVLSALILLGATMYKRDVLLPGVRRHPAGRAAPGRLLADRDRHQLGDRWSHRGRRPHRLHPGHPGRAALRARRAAAHRRLAGCRSGATVAGAASRCSPRSRRTPSRRSR